jgi:hypothetical protein
VEIVESAEDAEEEVSDVVAEEEAEEKVEAEEAQRDQEMNSLIGIHSLNWEDLLNMVKLLTWKKFSVSPFQLKNPKLLILSLRKNSKKKLWKFVQFKSKPELVKELVSKLLLLLEILKVI